MDRKEAIERLFYLKSKAENALINSNSHCDWLINDVKGTINAFSMAIEALKEPEIVHCKDCKLRKLEECAMQYECDCGEQHSWENDNDYCSWGIKAGEQNG